MISLCCFTYMHVFIHGLMEPVLCGELLSAFDRLNPVIVKPRVTPLTADMRSMSAIGMVELDIWIRKAGVKE